MVGTYPRRYMQILPTITEEDDSIYNMPEFKQMLEDYARDYKDHTENFVEPFEDALFNDVDAEYFALAAKMFEKNGKCDHGY